MKVCNQTNDSADSWICSGDSDNRMMTNRISVDNKDHKTLFWNDFYLKFDIEDKNR